MYFLTPSDAIPAVSRNTTDADTRYSAYMTTPHGAKLMLASGIRMFDIDGTRRRFPVMPDACQFSSVGADVTWLKTTLKGLLKEILAGSLTSGDIEDAF